MRFRPSIILEKAYNLIETRKRTIWLGTTDIKNDKMSDLVVRSAKKIHLEHPSAGPSTFSDSVFQAPVIPSVVLVPTTPSRSVKKMDDLTDVMWILAPLVRTLQGNTSAPFTVFQPESICYFYLPSHVQVPLLKGPVLEEDGQRASTSVCIVGRMTITSNDIVNCFKATSILTEFIWEMRVGYVWVHIWVIRSQCWEVTHLTLTFCWCPFFEGRRDQLGPYSSDEEAKYISLDEPIETRVLDARTNQSKPTEEPSKEPVKRILRRRI